jgi:hypothetical protein
MTPFDSRTLILFQACSCPGYILCCPCSVLDGRSREGAAVSGESAHRAGQRRLKVSKNNMMAKQAYLAQRRSSSTHRCWVVCVPGDSHFHALVRDGHMLPSDGSLVRSELRGAIMCGEQTVGPLNICALEIFLGYASPCLMDPFTAKI